MEHKRKLTSQEKNLINLLITKSKISFPDDWDKNLSVIPMQDGKMGSLYLIPNNIINRERKFGKQISDIQFNDLDGIEVIASLNLDEEGELFELDMWKTNYSKLIAIPIDLFT